MSAIHMSAIHDGERAGREAAMQIMVEAAGWMEDGEDAGCFMGEMMW